jgi:hypothetical protein
MKLGNVEVLKTGSNQTSPSAKLEGAMIAMEKTGQIMNESLTPLLQLSNHEGTTDCDRVNDLFIVPPVPPVSAWA